MAIYGFTSSVLFMPALMLVLVFMVFVSLLSGDRWRVVRAAFMNQNGKSLCIPSQPGVKFL